MSGTTLPIILAILGAIAAISAYRGIGRGGSRFYQLERDALLRRASFTLLAAVVLFSTSVGLLVYQQGNMAVVDDAAQATETASVVAVETPSPQTSTSVENVPPTLQIFATETPNPDLPTVTPTPELKNALVVGTGESGVWLRPDPSTAGEPVERLQDNSFLRVLPTEAVEADGFEWINVRTIGGQEGWVAAIFVEIVDD
jgi:hypothetical protein